jgi:hypothetical protein
MLCEICHKKLDPESKQPKNRPVLDHDHKTELCRGLICHRCNAGLGCFDDDIEVLFRAIKYLSEAKKRSKVIHNLRKPHGFTTESLRIVMTLRQAGLL